MKKHILFAVAAIACCTLACSEDNGSIKQKGGVSCSEHAECQTGTCYNGSCTCSSSVSCIGGASCDVETSLCSEQKLKKDGEACSSNSECASKHCNNKVCGTSSSSSEKKYGGESCTTGEQCVTGNCSNSVCTYVEKETGSECTVNAECVSKQCNTTKNVCVENKDIGAECTSSAECASEACDGRCMGACTDDSPCPSNMICNSGTCRSIVSCPNNSSKKCFMTMRLTPSATWIGGSLSESALVDGDFIGTEYIPTLPKSEDLTFCIRPLVSLIELDLATATMGEGFKLLQTPYLAMLAIDHYGLAFYQHFLGYYNDSMKQEKVTSFADMVGQMSGVDALASFMSGTGEMLAEPRVEGRTSNIGCMQIPLQLTRDNGKLEFTFSHHPKADDKYKDQPLIFEAYFRNSSLMTNKNRFDISIGGSEEEVAMESGVVKKYNGSVTFPINYSISKYDTQTVNTMVAETSTDVEDKRLFYLKANYSNNESFMCNEYDISNIGSNDLPKLLEIATTDNDGKALSDSVIDAEVAKIDGVCPGKVDLVVSDNKKQFSFKGVDYEVPEIQTITISDKDGLDCSSNQFGSDGKYKNSKYPNCKPNISFVLDHIEMYIEIPE